MPGLGAGASNCGIQEAEEETGNYDASLSYIARLYLQNPNDLLDFFQYFELN